MDSGSKERETRENARGLRGSGRVEEEDEEEEEEEEEEKEEGVCVNPR